ncbi:hypothetical protein INT47_003760 [Mucor saturninus]|uniref:DH domain-containing protein n=1 Tax=Mucor saturninus TaxID=64648 RepID=A0A8H7R7T2_9FUNG|nr:hypothetical protein INT47_003760 [Mucor saturninus]
MSVADSGTRPSLTINTKIKRWTNLFSSSKTSPTHSAIGSSSPSSEEEALTAVTEHSSVFKKFHVPHFHTKRSKSTSVEYTPFEPVAPQPIMPTPVPCSPDLHSSSPPPWEYTKTQKRHSMNVYDYDTQYHSDTDVILSDTLDLTPIESVPTVTTPTTPTNTNRIRRRSSCPTYDTLSLTTTESGTSTLVENDIMSITEVHTRISSVFKSYTHPADKKCNLKPCRKMKARAAEAAANGTVARSSSSFLKYMYIPNVFDPVTHDTILAMASIKPRKYQLYRKTSWKTEAKALMTWHHTLDAYMAQPVTPEHPKSPEKQEKNDLTRRFIMREFFVTEVNFWNQLYYTKVIFYDVIVNAIENGSQFVKQDNVDMFANLFDLMQFSAKLIHRLRHVQVDDLEKAFKVDCNNAHLGRILRDMAQDLVVFLRCALDYKENRKLLDNNVNNKGYLRYNQKLSTRKETSQFTMKDFLIIPIQRVARYGLLIADLIKHSEPTDADYNDLTIAHKIITSLASTMNSVQTKNKA